MKTIVYLRLPTSLFISAMLLSCTIYNNPSTFQHTDGKPISKSNHPSANDDGDWWPPSQPRNDAAQDSDTPEVKVTPPPKPQIQIRRIKVGCEKFVMPVLEEEVTISKSQLDAVKNTDKKAMMNLMIEHIDRVHKQNQDNQRKIAEAVQKHLTTCKN